MSSHHESGAEEDRVIGHRSSETVQPPSYGELLRRALEEGALAAIRLTEAAPDLLAALRPFEEIAGEGSDDFPDDTKVTITFGRTTFYAITLGDLRRVQTAIRKAEGR